jgi:3-oxoacyl-[acyl-carrier-protein] synthase II
MGNNRRVVITGMGVVAPNGIGIEQFWDSLLNGRSAVRKITRFDASSYPSQIAAEVLDFDPADYLDLKTAKRIGRFAQFSFASSQMAINDSKIDFSEEDPYRIGVTIGTAIGGGDIIESQNAIFFEKGLKRISPYAAVSISSHSASGIISCEYNLKGPNTTISAGCNSGLDATYLATNTIRLGDADIMIAGAGEATITPFCYAIFCASGNLSRENIEPHKAVKPYDLNADGMVLGEGGAVLIIEELEHALQRKAKIYGEVIGYSAANEAFDLFGTSMDNGAMIHNLKQALNMANLKLTDIDYINAHGNGILSYDIGETEAIKKVFGELAYSIPVTSIKPVTGHSISATGIWQTIACLLAMKHNSIPPTLNIQFPAPECDLDYVRDHYIKKEIQTAMINSHGFGGRLTTLVVRKFST